MTLTSALALVAVMGCSPALSAGDDLRASDPAELQRGPYESLNLFVEPGGNAARQADLWRTSDPVGAAVMDELALVPVSMWLGDWIPDVAGTVDDAMDRAGAELRVFTIYNIPDRDCGSFSAGGVSGRSDYDDFIAEVATGLDGRLAIVILEPDALALVDCLDAAGVSEREGMMADAVDTLTAAGAAVYLDAGDSAWIPADDMADRLLAANVAGAAGFALNVSHTEYSSDEFAYAQELRAFVGPDAHFVIDTSRNKLGPDATHEWCNPLGRANGRRPTLDVRGDGLDALLWIKPPGESDGNCNGGPDAGDWWPEYALDLALLAGY